MKAIVTIVAIVFAVVGWNIGGALSADGLGMALGILFGIMAGIPSTLILLESQRREHERSQQPRQVSNYYTINATPQQIANRRLEIEKRNR